MTHWTWHLSFIFLCFLIANLFKAYLLEKIAPDTKWYIGLSICQFIPRYWYPSSIFISILLPFWSLMPKSTSFIYFTYYFYYFLPSFFSYFIPSFLFFFLSSFFLFCFLSFLFLILLPLFLLFFLFGPSFPFSLLFFCARFSFLPNPSCSSPTFLEAPLLWYSTLLNPAWHVQRDFLWL